MRQKLEDLSGSKIDRNEKARQRQKLKQLTNIENLAKQQGLYQDPKLLENLEFILNYGFQDQFEVQIPVDQYSFSANLNREYLREDVDLLVKRYSRFSEKDFVIFGIISQGLTEPSNDNSKTVDAFDTSQMKEIIMQFVAGLSGIEDSLSGKLDSEVVVEPIAIYREL